MRLAWKQPAIRWAKRGVTWVSQSIWILIWYVGVVLAVPLSAAIPPIYHLTLGIEGTWYYWLSVSFAFFFKVLIVGAFLTVAIGDHLDPDKPWELSWILGALFFVGIVALVMAGVALAIIRVIQGEYGVLTVGGIGAVVIILARLIAVGTCECSVVKRSCVRGQQVGDEDESAV